MNAAIPEHRPATEEISGLIDRVTFHNDENGFCVLRVKVRGHREEVTVRELVPQVEIYGMVALSESCGFGRLDQ